MKVIFLDIDGVITSQRIGWFTYDMYAVNYINWLCEKLPAQVVISSSWRSSHSKEFFQEHFKYIHDDWKTGFAQPKRISQRPTRGSEIQGWLDNHPEIDDYLILDDDSDMLESQMHRFVKTSTYNGLLHEHQKQIKEMFSELDAQFHSGINPSVEKPWVAPTEDDFGNSIYD